MGCPLSEFAGTSTAWSHLLTISLSSSFIYCSSTWLLSNLLIHIEAIMVFFTGLHRFLWNLSFSHDRMLCYSYVHRNSLTVPRYSTVACLNINSRVSDITSHYVVGEVWLQDMEIGIDCNLKTWKKSQINSSSALKAVYKYLFLINRIICVTHLQDVGSRRHVSDVNPLTVNVGSIDVMASWA